MKNLILSVILLIQLLPVFVCPQTSMAQTQNIRGKVTDVASKSPIIGANVLVLGSNPLIGSSTDENGNFRLLNVPIGRVNLKIAFIGYEDVFMKDIIVNAGKEVILEVGMTESITSLNEVVVTFQRSEDAKITNNEMATVSSRPFNPSETLKYAGSLGDPSRMAANFAGVSGANDARNDIIVRGNSPASLLWRLEGVNIPNPNHFGALGTSGGPVSMLNANLLAKSDFMTGAFPAEYANALGSVFDLRLRKGNDEKHEFLTQVGFNGVEVGLEGPFSKKKTASGRQASYLLNYRYSLFGLMSAIGFQIAGTPYYQDLTFKADIPVGKKGTFSAWVLGGRSNITFLGKDVSTDGDAYGDENNNTFVNFGAGVGAVSYEHRFTDRTHGKITLSASQSFQNFDGDTVIYKGDTKDIEREIRNESARFSNDKFSINAVINHKINAKNKLTGGFILDFSQFNLKNTRLLPVLNDLRNTTGETMLGQGYLQWKHRFNEKLTLNSGLSFMSYELNRKSVVEPRIGVNYVLNEKSTINVAYGLHSNLQPILLSFYQNRNADGTYSLTNKDLGFTRSHHFVVGLEQSLTENLRLKVETYYQSLFNVPVETRPSYYSVLTEGVDFAPTDIGNLVNKGTGTNYGVELTLEKYFSNSYYFLLTTSIFDSKYKGSDGIERNTPFNGRYVVNFLAGKEFKIGSKDNILSINWRITSAGGRFLRPVDLVQSAQTGITIYDDDNAFTAQQPAYFRTDLKFSYKINRKRLTHEIAIDLQNITNHQNVLQQAYNPRTQRVGTAYQQGFLPIPFYRLTF